MNGKRRSRLRRTAGVFGLSVFMLFGMLFGAACSSDSEDVLADELSANQPATDAESTNAGLQAEATTDPATDALPLPEAEPTQQSVLVVLSDGDSASSQLVDAGSVENAEETDSVDIETTTSTTAAPGETSTSASVETTAPPTTVATTTTAPPTTASTTTTAPPTTAAPTTAAPTTSTTTTTTTTNPPPSNSSFPSDEVVMVSSGAQTTFASQVAGSTPVVIWYWLPG